MAVHGFSNHVPQVQMSPITINPLDKSAPSGQMSPFTIHALDKSTPSGQTTPFTDIYSLESTRIMRPIPIRPESYREINEWCDRYSQYTDLITDLSESALDDEKNTVMEADQESTEEEQYETYHDKVARLSTQQIVEALETHHRTIKRFYRKYEENDVVPPTEELYHAEEWCMAAYLQLRMRR
jgi:hypothetical protein